MQDTSETQPSTGETHETHDINNVSTGRDMTETLLKAFNQSMLGQTTTFCTCPISNHSKTTI